MTLDRTKFIESFQEMLKAYEEKDIKDAKIQELEYKIDFLEGGLELLSCYIFALQIKDKSKRGPIELQLNGTDASKWVKEMCKKVLPSKIEIKNKLYPGEHTEKISKFDPYEMEVPNHGWTSTRIFIMHLQEEACKAFKRYEMR